MSQQKQTSQIILSLHYRRLLLLRPFNNIKMSFGEKLGITYGHCFPVYISEARFLKEDLSSEKRESLSSSLYKMSHLFRQAETSSSEAGCFNAGRSIRLRLPPPLTWKSSSVMRYCILHVFLQLLFWVPGHSFCLFVALAPYTVQKVHMLCLPCCRCFKSTDPPVCSYCVVAALLHPPWCY